MKMQNKKERDNQSGNAVLSKTEWIQKYAPRIHRLYSQWQNPLGLAKSYVNQIKDDLEAYYDNPLKRMLVETSY